MKLFKSLDALSQSEGHTLSEAAVAGGSFLMNSLVAPNTANTEDALRCSLCKGLCVFVCKKNQLIKDSLKLLISLIYL